MVTAAPARRRTQAMAATLGRRGRAARQSRQDREVRREHAPMARANPFAPCVFVPYSHRHNLPKGSVIHDVSSYADFPFCTLSPMWVHGGIPVPGMSGKTSDTV